MIAASFDPRENPVPNQIAPSLDLAQAVFPAANAFGEANIQ
jgi:hypothetical protein